MKRKMSEIVLKKLIDNKSGSAVVISQDTYLSLIRNLGKHRIKTWEEDNKIKLHIRG